MGSSNRRIIVAGQTFCDENRVCRATLSGLKLEIARMMSQSISDFIWYFLQTHAKYRCGYTRCCGDSWSGGSEAWVVMPLSYSSHAPARPRRGKEDAHEMRVVLFPRRGMHRWCAKKNCRSLIWPCSLAFSGLPLSIPGGLFCTSQAYTLIVIIMMMGAKSPVLDANNKFLRRCLEGNQTRARSEDAIRDRRWLSDGLDMAKLGESRNIARLPAHCQPAK